MRKIFIAGHNGMVGSSILRTLNKKRGIIPILSDRKNLNLLSQNQVEKFFEYHKPDEVVIAAAKVGGIFANNTRPAEFIYENLQIQNNLIHQSYLSGVKQLIFLGSSCIYPKNSPQPITENYLLTGPLEPTNEPYAIAKIAGIKLCESYNRQYGTDYRSVMPTNLYGPGDNFHPEFSHVVPAMLRKFHLAKEENWSFVEIWGTGKPKRDLLHVDDLARAVEHVLNLTFDEYSSITSPMQSHVNVGSGVEVSIEELAYLVSKIVGYQGQIKFDTTKLDGTERKLLSSSKIRNFGWKPTFNLEDGLKQSFQWYLKNKF